MAKTKRYRGYVARELLDTHTYEECIGPQTVEQKLELTKTQASILAQRMKAKQIPLHFEHDQKMYIGGRVTDAWIENNQSDLVAEFELDAEESPTAGFFADLLDKCVFNGLSLTHYADTLDPEELSVVEKGARRGTWITTAISASNASSAALKSPLYKTTWTTNSVIQASVRATDSNMDTSSLTLVHNPASNVSYSNQMGGATDLKKIMEAVLPPNGAHPFSSPAEEQQKATFQMIQQFMANQMKQQQQQQQQQQSVNPPPAVATNNMQVDSTPKAQESVPQTPAQQPTQQQPAATAVDQRTRLQLAAQALVQPNNRIPNSEEKALVLRTLTETAQDLDQQKAKTEELTKQIEQMKKEKELIEKEKEEARKQLEDKQKSQKEVSQLFVNILGKMQPNADPEQMKELQKAAAEGNVTELTHKAYNAAIAASAQQAQLAALQSLNQQQQQNMALNQAWEGFNKYFNNNNTSVPLNNTNYSAPIQASQASQLNLYNNNNNSAPAPLLPPLNDVSYNYYDSKRIEASRNLWNRQNQGGASTINYDESWKRAPYVEDSAVSRVLNRNYNGVSVHNWTPADVLNEARKLMHGGGAFAPIDMNLLSDRPR